MPINPRRTDYRPLGLVVPKSPNGDRIASVPLNERQIGATPRSGSAGRLDLPTLAARLRASLASRGLSQSEAALRLGWPPPRVSEILSGRANVRIDRLLHLLNTLDIPLSELL